MSVDPGSVPAHRCDDPPVTRAAFLRASELGHGGEPMRCAGTGRRAEAIRPPPRRGAKRPVKAGVSTALGVRTAPGSASLGGSPERDLWGPRLNQFVPARDLEMVAYGWRLGGMQMRSNGSRFRRSSALAVVGGCLAVYAVLAVGFHWFVEPTLGKNQAVSAYDPAPARIVPLSGPPAVAPSRSEAASRLASNPAASTKVTPAGPTAPDATPSQPSP